MKTNSSILLIICLLFPFSGIFSQILKFSTPTWNFGTIEEEGGTVSHTFDFVNDAKSPVVITDIKTSCGCTTFDYSRKPIAVGASSTIEIKYDPMYRPGAFSRDITIFTSADKEPTRITITGDVTPRRRSVQEEYPYILGEGVRITTLYAYLQNVAPSAPTQAQAQIINTSDKTRSIEFRDQSPTSHLKVLSATTLKPGESAAVDLIYEIAADGGIYGELDDIVEIYIDGKISSMTLRTRAYAIEDFGINVKKGDACGRFSEKFINFEAFSLNSNDLTREFTIENIGTERLHIRGVNVPQGVQMRAGGEDLSGQSIGSADRLTVTVTLQKEELEIGAFVKYATFILSDAEQPVVRVKIVGEVSN
ncbi:MAG: DUF1573 domain-containing protein [Rikenellaceae bacterium]